MDEDHGEGKADRRAYFPFYVDDWAGGTIGFTLEQEGFFLRFVKCQWARKGDLPDDIKWLAAALHCDPRTVRRLRQFLIDAGKVHIAENGMLYNKRMRLEIAKDRAKIERRSAGDRAKIGRRSGEDRPKIGPMFAKKPNDFYAGARAPLPEPEPEPREELQPFSSETAREKDDEEPRVAFREGKIELLNGLRSYWLERFDGDGDRLELGLIQAAGFVQPNSTKPLEAQVSAQLARQCGEKRDRDKRYAAAASVRAPPSGSPHPQVARALEFARQAGMTIGGGT
jgi:uncharacterized protein YdaU (DUF1376 family)